MIKPPGPVGAKPGNVIPVRTRAGVNAVRPHAETAHAPIPGAQNHPPVASRLWSNGSGYGWPTNGTGNLLANQFRAGLKTGYSGIARGTGWLLAGIWALLFEGVFATRENSRWMLPIDNPSAASYRTDRTLQESNYYLWKTPAVSLETLIERAIIRSRFGGMQASTPGSTERPPRIMVIGAGKRHTELALKNTYGNAVRLIEFSDRHEDRPGVDEMLPAGDIGARGVLADVNGTIDAVYSIYGSYHAADQLSVLQNVFDALKPGGEAFLMWCTLPKVEDGRLCRIVQLFRQYPHIFRDAGVDIVAIPADEFATETYVYMKKRGFVADIDALLWKADEYAASHPGEGSIRSGINSRLEDWPAEKLRMYLRNQIPSITAQRKIQMESLAKALGYSSRSFREAREKLVNHFTGEGQLDDLRAGLPVEDLLRREIDPAIARTQGTSLPFTRPLTPRRPASGGSPIRGLY